MKTVPTLILDRHKCLRNIEKMAVRARQNGLGFRPHFKTHQSAEIGDWFRDFGVSQITVSSFRMAEYFAMSGWKDLLVAFPFNPSEMERMKDLSGKISLSVLVDSPEVLPFLKNSGSSVRFYIDIDTGYGRTGIRPDDPETIQRIIRVSAKIRNLDFAGFYCHAGHSYQAGSSAAREQIHRKAMDDLKALKEQFSREDPVALYGDTPNCSTQEYYEGIDTITPGNFVFYDLFQQSIASCSEDEIAVAMACPVVSKYPRDRRLLIHGGAVHFSKEVLQLEGRKVFGKGVGSGKWTGSGKGVGSGKGADLPRDQGLHEEFYLSAISQEHGIIRDCPPGVFERIRIGDLLFLLPVHSCLTANLMGGYVTLEGKRIRMQSRPE